MNKVYDLFDSYISKNPHLSDDDYQFWCDHRDNNQLSSAVRLGVGLLYIPDRHFFMFFRSILDIDGVREELFEAVLSIFILHDLDNELLVDTIQRIKGYDIRIDYLSIFFDDISDIDRTFLKMKYGGTVLEEYLK